MGTGRGQRRAVTLVEVVVSLIVLGVAVTAGVQALGSFAAGSKSWQDRSTAIELANALMAQVYELPFSDPSGSTAIGRDSGETTGDRSTYDDIDDYDGWDASPPRDTSNASMSAYAGFRQQVSVVFDTTLAAATGVSLGAQDFKKITVTISKENRVLVRLVAVRSKQSVMTLPGSVSGGSSGSGASGSASVGMAASSGAASNAAAISTTSRVQVVP